MIMLARGDIICDNPARPLLGLIQDDIHGEKRACGFSPLLRIMFPF